MVMIKEIKTGRRGTRPRRAAGTSGTRPRRRRTPRRGRRALSALSALAPAASTAPTAFPTTACAMHHTTTSRILFIASPGPSSQERSCLTYRPVSGPGRFLSLPRFFEPCLLSRVSLWLVWRLQQSVDVSSTACWFAGSSKKFSEKPAARRPAGGQSSLHLQNNLIYPATPTPP